MSAKLNNNKTSASHSKSKRKDIKREEALLREITRGTRSSEYQLELISQRRGESRKESERLSPLVSKVTIHMPEERDES